MSGKFTKYKLVIKFGMIKWICLIVINDVRGVCPVGEFKECCLVGINAFWGLVTTKDVHLKPTAPPVQPGELTFSTLQ